MKTFAKFVFCKDDDSSDCNPFYYYTKKTFNHKLVHIICRIRNSLTPTCCPFDVYYLDFELYNVFNKSFRINFTYSVHIKCNGYKQLIATKNLKYKLEPGDSIDEYLYEFIVPPEKESDICICKSDKVIVSIADINIICTCIDEYLQNEDSDSSSLSE